MCLVQVSFWLTALVEQPSFSPWSSPVCCVQVVALAVKRLHGALPVLVAADTWEDTGEELDDTFLPDAEIWRRTSSGGAYNAEVCHACLCCFCAGPPHRAPRVQGRMEAAAGVHLARPALGAQSVNDAQTCVIMFIKGGSPGSNLVRGLTGCQLQQSSWHSLRALHMELLPETPRRLCFVHAQQALVWRCLAASVR